MKHGPMILLVLSCSLTGCAWLAPDYQRPALDMPEKWTAEKKNQGARDETLETWWQAYQDPILQKLVDEALAHNDDIAVAGARLQQAKAQYDFYFSNQFPLLAATGVAMRLQSDFANGPLLSQKPGNAGFVGGLLSYEVDLWGKLASASEAAKAGFRSTGYYQEAIKLSVASATGQLYFDILALDADIKLMQSLIRSQEETHRLVEKQFEVEAVNGLVLRQAEANLAAVRAELPQLIEQRDRAETSLTTLLGRSPRQIVEGKLERGPDLDALPVPPLVPGDLPSELLERRPDIAAAEQALIASHFNIGFARAAYFPSISLLGLLGVSSLDIQNLYTGTVRTWALGGTLAGPLIDFGRTDSAVDLAIAQDQERLALYKGAIRTAFGEVKNALSAQANARDGEKEQADKENALQDALRLAKLRLANGYASSLDVLNIESGLYQAQIAGVAAKLRRLNASVELYKAVGGGWQLDEKPQKLAHTT